MSEEWKCATGHMTTRPHHGNGLCQACYMRQWRAERKDRVERERLDLYKEARWDGVQAAVAAVRDAGRRVGVYCDLNGRELTVRSPAGTITKEIK